jgi:hypothetical protein
MPPAGDEFCVVSGDVHGPPTGPRPRSQTSMCEGGKADAKRFQGHSVSGCGSRFFSRESMSGWSTSRAGTRVCFESHTADGDLAGCSRDCPTIARSSPASDTSSRADGLPIPGPRGDVRGRARPTTSRRGIRRSTTPEPSSSSSVPGDPRRDDPGVMRNLEAAGVRCKLGHEALQRKRRPGVTGAWRPFIRFDVPVDRGLPYITDTANWSRTGRASSRSKKAPGGRPGDTARIVTRC